MLVSIRSINLNVILKKILVQIKVLRVLEEITVSMCGCQIARRLDSSRLQTTADRLSFPRVNCALNRSCLDCNLPSSVA